jgi:hypothetical protein
MWPGDSVMGWVTVTRRGVCGRGQGPGGPWALLWLLRFWQAIRLG